MTHSFKGDNRGLATDQTVVAVIVAYNPSGQNLEKLTTALSDQVSSIIIVDNGSVDDILPLVGKLAIRKTKVIYLGVNLGLAAAMNRGINLARGIGASHVMLFDQDSIPSTEMVSRLLNACNMLIRQGQKVAAVGPICRDPRIDSVAPFVRYGWFRIKQFHCTGGNLMQADTLISSGSLYPMETVDAVGYMDVDLFIDKIDTEWFLRARSLGYYAWGVSNAFMDHFIGEDARVVWFFRRRNFILHRPFRYYYIFRNSLLLYRRRYISIKWISSDVLRLMGLFVFLLFTSPNRLESFRFIVKGVFDGVKSVGGVLVRKD